MDLSSFITKDKTVTVEFPGCKGFEVDLSYLSREELLKIRKKCLKTTIDRKTRQPVEELDEELFLKAYIPSVIKGWTGFKLEYLAELVPVEFGKDVDLEAEVNFTEKNAIELMSNSQLFDTWVSEVIGDVANFNKSS